MRKLNSVAVIGTAAAIAAGVAGCGGSTAAFHFHSRLALPRDARVVGVAKPCGDSVCYGVRSASVSVLDANGHLAATSAPGPRGRFSFELIPGQYTVVLNVNGAALTQARVSAKPHRTAHTNLTNPHIH